MIQGKIKEWHLDPELLNRLASGGGIGTSILADYLKKTDIIDKEQLDPYIFTEIQTDLQEIIDMFAEYRKKDAAVTLDEIDSEFRALINRMLAKIEALEGGSGSSGSGGSSADIQTAINEALETQLPSAVSNELDRTLDGKVNALVDTKIDTLLEGEEDTRLKDAMGSAVVEALEGSAAFSELQSTIMDSISETYATKAEQENLSSSFELLNNSVNANQILTATSISSLENQINTNCRHTDVKIGLNDLTDEVSATITNTANAVATLSGQSYANKVYGQTGQIVLVGNDNTLFAEDPIIKTNIAETAEETEAAKTAKVEEFYSLADNSKYILTLEKWNRSARRNEYVEQNPEEENMLAYADHTLHVEHFIADGITLTENETEISGTNESLIDTAYAAFGIYGTRIKLYTSIVLPETPETQDEPVEPTDPEEPTEPEEPTDSEEPEEPSNPLQYEIKIDNSLTYTIEVPTTEAKEHSCFLCVERLSEGPHRIEFKILPGAEFKIDAVISLDDTHAGIMAAEHIKSDEFYTQPLYDYIDYVTEPEYDELKSENVGLMPENPYEYDDIPAERLERRLIYSDFNQALYYCFEGHFIRIARDQTDRLAALEARIAALEA